ncbi:uncharacterized protein LOC119554510 [Drosophila subpulchrella]|uniref:uncharacterized protein LOC119554510 n=1 Tax=Drosophila subpulchrella TaxID=1486046 RepID=UPI0018A127E4|nr:uncharacterized protein LOC119554510 [Drosophila subpulchrella]
MEITVPPEDAHWSLKFVDIWKPFPQQIVANATYKVIRFFYPPFAVEAVNVTHVVSDPELNGLNVALLLGFPLFLAGIGYGVYKYVLRVNRVVRKAPARLDELEARMKAKYGPEYKQGIWKRRDIPEPFLDLKSPCEPVVQSKHDLETKSSNVFVDTHWLPESIENFINADTSEENSKANVTFKEEVEYRFFDGSSRVALHSDLVEQIIRTVKESSAVKRKGAKTPPRA